MVCRGRGGGVVCGGGVLGGGAQRAAGVVCVVTGWLGAVYVGGVYVLPMPLEARAGYVVKRLEHNEPVPRVHMQVEDAYAH